MNEIRTISMLVKKLAKKNTLDKKDRKDLDKLSKLLKKYHVVAVIDDVKKIYPLKYKNV